MRSLEQSDKSLVISINNMSLIKSSDRVIWLEEGSISYDGLWENCPLREKDLGFKVNVESKESKIDLGLPEEIIEAKSSVNSNSTLASDKGNAFFVAESSNSGSVTCSTINRMINALGG
jgi:hypothetical protein